MKNGLFFEQDELIYYKNDKPYHAGVVEVEGKLYYIGKGGRAVKGMHIVHREMGNGLLPRGTYTFGEDYVLVEGSFIKPRSHKKRRKSKKLKTIKQKLIIVGCVLATCLLLLIPAMVTMFEKPSHSASPSVTDDAIELPSFEEEVLLCSEEAAKQYRREISLSEAVAAGAPYRAFRFPYKLNGEDGTLRLSESVDLSAASEWVLEADKTELQIDNLKTDTTYYYEVTVGEETYSGSFQTAAGTRFVYWQGGYNTRDIGGYTTQDGKTLKQGMIIRGTEIDGLVKAKYFTDAKTAQRIGDEFGFVHDMDLRYEAIYTGKYTSRFGEDVSHRFYHAPMYGEIFSTEYKQSLKDVFSDLAKPSNYPMYMHCTHGADRTGTIVFLLQGVLGLSEEDMYEEYRLTSYFVSTYADNTYMDVMCEGLAIYPGDTLQEKICYYLTEDIGVTQEELNSIRAILLEE